MAWSILSREWHCVYYQGGQCGRGVPDKTNSLRSYLIVSAPSAGVLRVCEAKTYMYQSWFKTKNVCVKCVHSVKDPFPTLSAYVDKMDQTFPLHFFIIARTGRLEGLGTRLRRAYCITLYFAVHSLCSGVSSLRRRVTCPSYGRGKTLSSLVPRPHSRGGRTKSDMVKKSLLVVLLRHTDADPSLIRELNSTG